MTKYIVILSLFFLKSTLAMEAPRMMPPAKTTIIWMPGAPHYSPLHTSLFYFTDWQKVKSLSPDIEAFKKTVRFRENMKFAGLDVATRKTIHEGYLCECT